MKTYLLLISMFLGLTASAQIPAPLEARFQHVVDSISNKFGVKGISAAVMIPDYGTWAGTSGISEQNVPLEPEMLFCMGSNTKTYMTVLSLMLQEEGRLDLDDSIGIWIQGYPNINGQATIRQCLQHTSGIADYFHNSSLNDSILGKPSKVWDYDGMMRMAGPMNFTPGSSWSYSNTNYIILGYILEEVMKKPAFQLLHEYLLDPYNLSETFYYQQHPASFTEAHPWTMNITGTHLTDLAESPYIDQLFSLATTAGGLMSTARDNVKFWDLLNRGELLSEESWNEMTDMIKVSGSTYYGLGMMKRRNSNKKLVYEHGVTFFGFLNENLMDIESGVCITVYTNQDSLNNGGLQELYVVNLQKEILNSDLVGVKPAPVAALHCYPNPAENFLYLDMEGMEAGTAEVYDLQGHRLLSQTVSRERVSLNLESLAPGVYSVRLLNEQGTLLRMARIVHAG